jgi:hypothetical protein
VVSSAVTLQFHLGASKYWWAYLGVKSNPAILALAADFDRAVLFDETAELPAISAGLAGQRVQYFQIFWDGASDPRLFRASQRILGEAPLHALVVGEDSGLRSGEATSLYPEGPLRFDAGPLHFDRRTASELRKARLKTWTMPAKNILQNRSAWRDQVDLLAGPRRVVFCGSYGTIPEVTRSLCERHNVPFELFSEYPFYLHEQSPSFATYSRYLADDAAFLADLYTRAQINAAFLLSAVHLLGREYFVEKIRAAQFPFYVNGYATGVNVNVYTTPWYSQHVFPDFGSAVGTGNYPRLADLQYFRKQFVPIPLNDQPEVTLAATLNGTLGQHFDTLWNAVQPRLQAALRP